VLKAVFFDLFRTLGEFEGKVSDIDVCDLLQGHGYDVYPQTFHHAFSFVTFVDNPRIGFTNYPDMFRKAFERIGIDVDEETLRAVSKLYTNNHFKLYPEASQTVKRIKGLGLKTAIVTTPPRFWFESGIKPILNDVDYICTSSEAGCEKSNPRIFMKTLQMLGVSATETVVIGDDPELDIRIPKSLGMMTIHLTTGEAAAEADAKANKLSEVVEIMKRLRNGVQEIEKMS
jgi:HAD superfamily hydrolase (TIGR01549 family)